MILQRYNRFITRCWELRYIGINHAKTKEDENILNLCKYLNISKSKAQYMCIKYPTVRKLNKVKIKSLLECLFELGFTKEALVEEPLLSNFLPVTLRFRFKVLKECGFANISPTHLSSYLNIMKEKNIGELKERQLIPSYVNIENKLASILTQWPTSLTTLVLCDVNEMTLYNLRLKILQRYLELILDLTEDEFYRGLRTYPTIKHRPLEIINEALTLLQLHIKMPSEKIKSNFYLIHLDPENLKQILYNFRSIGGIDIKEVIRMHPKIAMRNYSAMIEIRKMLKEYGISDEAQTRCFQIYTLGLETVQKRLEETKSIPEFEALFNHPRFLKMILYKNKAMKRILSMYYSNKKCLSLNILSGSSVHYELFKKSPGDRFGKGRDLLFCISQCMENMYSISDIRNIIKRHPFWINISIVHVKFTYQQLSTEFSPNDIYENCQILLYPKDKINEVLHSLNTNKPNHFLGHIDIGKLNSLQKLSLVLYILERKHYFTGNGVWVDDKSRNIGTESLKELNSEYPIDTMATKCI